MEKSSKYKCIIIDDEPIAIRVISSYIDKLDGFEVIGTYTNALEAVKPLHSQRVDLLFLDIQMPGINGLDFIKSIPNPPRVVFTTAFRNYAADAFDVDALDYLLKPIPFERFLMAINRFLNGREATPSTLPAEEVNDSIVLKSDKKNYRIKVDDILYIESLDDYIRVCTKQSKLVCYMRLTAMVEMLKLHENILRVHRSYIVNTKHIDVFTHYNMEIAGKEIPIGRSYRDSVMGRLDR